MGMKLVCACVISLLFMALPVFAQDQQPPSADDIVAKMQSKLNLTQDQVSAVTPIIEKYTSKREELRQGVEDGTIERGDMRGQMKQLKEDEKQDLSQILSADQLSQWEQMQAHGHHSGGSAGGGSWGGSSEGGNSNGGENSAS